MEGNGQNLTNQFQELLQMSFQWRASINFRFIWILARYSNCWKQQHFGPLPISLVYQYYLFVRTTQNLIQTVTNTGY